MGSCYLCVPALWSNSTVVREPILCHFNPFSFMVAFITQVIVFPGARCMHACQECVLCSCGRLERSPNTHQSSRPIVSPSESWLIPSVVYRSPFRVDNPVITVDLYTCSSSAHLCFMHSTALVGTHIQSHSAFIRWHSASSWEPPILWNLIFLMLLYLLHLHSN